MMIYRQVTDLLTYDNFLEKYKVQKTFTRTSLRDILTYNLTDVLLTGFDLIELEKELGFKYNPSEYNSPENYSSLCEYYISLMRVRFSDNDSAIYDINHVSFRYYSKEPNIIYLYFRKLMVSKKSYKKIVEFYTK